MWNLGARVSTEVSDIRRRHRDTSLDVVTSHQNIHYFPVAERNGLLGHVRAFLNRGGRPRLRTVCQGRGSTAPVLDLWGAMTAGGGRVSERTEIVARTEEAGFVSVTARSVIPGESVHAFVGTNPNSGRP